MLDVVVHLHVDAVAGEHFEKSIDGPVSGCIRVDPFLADPHLRLQRHNSRHVTRRAGAGEFEPAPLVIVVARRQVLVLKDRPNLITGDLASLSIRLRLNHTAELDLQSTGKIEGVIGLQQVGDAALARLRIDTDDGFVAPPEVFRVDREIRHCPRQRIDGHALMRCIRRHRLETLLDGVLMRPAEGRVDQIAGPGATLRHGQASAVLGSAFDLVEVAEIDLRVDSLSEKVDTEGHQIDISGALPVTEQASLDAVGAREVTELRGGHRGSAVIVRMQAEQDVLAVIQPTRHPLDRVGVDVRRGHLDSGGEVDDDLTVGSGLEHFDHLVAYFEREFEFSSGEALG